MVRDQGATVCRVLTIMLNYVYSDRREGLGGFDRILAALRSGPREILNRETARERLAAGVGGEAQRPRGHRGGRATLVELLIYLRFEVLRLASGHGPGQERLCSEQRILTMLKGLTFTMPACLPQVGTTGAGRNGIVFCENTSGS
jgi:hypothetical protein